MRLLLIEDDDILGEGLRDFLRAEGHTVDWCRRIADARDFRFLCRLQSVLDHNIKLEFANT